MLAINQKTRRLPGFRFEAFAPAREDVLPRMDVALFVGFASTGPLGIPVVVESAEQFKAIFGNDLPLVWDRVKGEVLHAFLAPTVRAFFRNGGKRCWIMRVARAEPGAENPLDRARYNFFPLNGLARGRFDAQGNIELSPAFARARSKGSWSDELQIGTALLSKAVKVVRLAETGNEKRVTLEIGAGESVSSGDLLRLTLAGVKDEKQILLLVVDELREAEQIQPPPPEDPPFGKRFVEFTSKRFVWLGRLSPATRAGKKHDVQISLWSRQKNAAAEAAPSSFHSARAAVFVLEKSPDTALPQIVRLTFADLAAADAPAAGELLFTTLNDEAIGLQVEEIIFGTVKKAEETELVCRAMSCHRKSLPTREIVQAERVTFELRIKKDRQTFIKLGELAFNAGQRRFWGSLPTDEEWYRFFHETDKNPPAWTQNAETSNFPLAGGGENEGFYFPLFAAVMAENYLGAVPLPGTKLQRDGLETFDADLFLDPKLKGTRTGNLLNEAEYIRYLSPRPRALRGIHAALVPETVSKIAIESTPTNPSYTNCSLDECTLIAVPDAVHRGWSKTSVTGGTDSPADLTLPLRPDWWHFEDGRNAAPKRVSRPPSGRFLDCAIRFVEAPQELRVLESHVTSGKFTIAWEPAESEAGETFVLEESPSPEFEFPAEIARGAARRFEVLKHRAGVYYYRVRAEIGSNFSDWSSGLAVRIPETEDWAVNQAYTPDVLLEVQRALLRMCAARGDLFALLSLPEHFDDKDAFAHVGALRASAGGFKPSPAAAAAAVEPLSADETRALSFGAVYHPWLLTHEEDFTKFRNIPPDGAIGGVFARRAHERGAWIAPANEVLEGVLGLAKEVRRGQYLEFQDNLINLVRKEPRGFVVLDSDTLSTDADWRSINVRRLINLLRRLAVKHGAEYVFEPHNESFRRQVQRGFEELLDLLFTRGAFAGTVPANSYQVVVSNTVNSPRSVEQGRFVVELRVAPSLPLKFVTVRLVQAGARSSVIEGF